MSAVLDLAKIKVTLVRSMIGTPEKHRRILRSMGLRRTGASRSFDDSPSVRGKIFHVKYLLEVEESK